MMNARLNPKYVSNILTKNLERLIVKEDTILVSCSGSIGNIVICTKNYDGFALSQDAIRIIASEQDNIGLLYAFLNSKPGQFLITRNKSGSVIEHIYEDDVASLNVPLLPKKLRIELTRLIRESCRLRVKANALLERAEEEMKKTCRLPELSELKSENIIPNESEATIFSWNFNQRLKLNGQFGLLRIDATFHDPTACTLAQHIHKSDIGTTLGEVLIAVRNSSLRKRIYVDDENQGVPLIGGKQLIQLRPEVKCLSKSLTRNISNETVKNGWTLVSCGGTLGRVQFVHRNYAGWAASQHVMRLIPNTLKVFSGYLYAFMASPYGQSQIQERSYGSVIPEIRDFQFNSIAISIPADKGKSVHEKVIEAFDARADARQAEDKAIELFMTAIKEGREKTESTWGRDYGKS
jgi:type I restriction enzyme S subunit